MTEDLIRRDCQRWSGKFANFLECVVMASIAIVQCKYRIVLKYLLRQHCPLMSHTVIYGQPLRHPGLYSYLILTIPIYLAVPAFGGYSFSLTANLGPH